MEFINKTWSIETTYQQDLFNRDMYVYVCVSEW
jgi:hypothetical protein